MIIGNGMIAQAFCQWRDDPEVLIFASGVSNSLQSDERQFARERELLQRTIAEHFDKTIVYFSSCSLYDPSLQSSPYVQHKIEMEKLVQNAPRFLLLRLPQVVGNTQSPTLVRTLFQHIQQQKIFPLWQHSYRNLIDIEDVKSAVNFVLKKGLFTNQPLNIAAPQMLSIQQIVTFIEQISGKKAHYENINKGAYYQINIDKIMPIFQQLNINFEQDYFVRIMAKYYAE